MAAPQHSPGCDVTTAFVTTVLSTELRDDPVKDHTQRASLVLMAISGSHQQSTARPEQVLGVCWVSHGATKLSQPVSRALGRGECQVEKALRPEWMKRSMEGAVTAPALKKEAETTSPSKKREALGEMFPNYVPEAAC